jgi:hypothetical protein
LSAKYGYTAREWRTSLQDDVFVVFELAPHCRTFFIMKARYIGIGSMTMKDGGSLIVAISSSVNAMFTELWTAKSCRTFGRRKWRHSLCNEGVNGVSLGFMVSWSEIHAELLGPRSNNFCCMSGR